MITRIEVRPTETTNLYLINLIEEVEKHFESDDMVTLILEEIELYNADYYGTSEKLPLKGKLYNWPDELYIRAEKNHLSAFYGIIEKCAREYGLIYKDGKHYPTWIKK